MAKQKRGGKVTPPKINSSTPQTKNMYKCKSCSKWFTEAARAKNFSKGYSPFWEGDNGYFPLCKDCVDKLFNHYKACLGSEEEALKRICLHFDVYWSPEIFNMLGNTSSSRPRFRAYMEKANLLKYYGKTYDDTLDEEAKLLLQDPIIVPENDQLPDDESQSETEDMNTVSQVEQVETDEDIKLRFGITSQDEEFWGYGRSAYDYVNLVNSYKKWTHDNEDLTVEQQGLYKQLCIAELGISEQSLKGGKIDTLQNSMANIMSKLGISPNQTKENDIAEKNTFGVLMGNYEKRKHIDKCLEKNQIVQYITVYFLGHLCKMLKIKNMYARMYEEEMDRYRVERPEYANEDDEAIFESVFAEGLKSDSHIENGDDYGSN